MGCSSQPAASQQPALCMCMSRGRNLHVIAAAETGHREPAPHTATATEEQHTETLSHTDGSPGLVQGEPHFLQHHVSREGYG